MSLAVKCVRVKTRHLLLGDGGKALDSAILNYGIFSSVEAF